MHGNEREPTWPKRAEGLVKKGRAYRLAEDHICLTGEIVPDDRKRQSDHAETEYADRQTEVRSSDRNNKLSEENTMDAQERKNEITETVMAGTDAEETVQQTTDWGKLNINYVLDRIEAVRRDTEYLQKTIAALDNMAVGQGPGDVAGEEKAKALADVVRCRETTNQKLLDLYGKMYDDLKPMRNLADDNPKLKVLKLVEEVAISSTSENLEIILERVESLCDSLRFI